MNGESNNRRGHDLRRTFITLAQVDGARRDFLETITHGPRGDIMNVYTTLPWPALCEEVSKLKISLREGAVLDGDFRGLATTFATTQLISRKRWTKEATPAGFETVRSIAKDHEDPRFSAEKRKIDQPSGKAHERR